MKKRVSIRNVGRGRHRAAGIVLSLTVSALLVSRTATGAPDEIRVWTSTGGETITASLAEVSDDGQMVTLLGEKGGTVRIPLEKLCEADRTLITVGRIKESADPHVIYEGTNMTFRIDAGGALSIAGTGAKVTWPKGRPPKATRSRHTGKLIQPEIAPGKEPVTVRETMRWTRMKSDQLIAMVAKGVERSERAIKDGFNVKPYDMFQEMGLEDNRLCGFKYTFHANADLRDVPRVKAKQLTDEGRLAFTTLTLLEHDGSEKSDLTELSETFNLHQQRALLKALRNVPYDALTESNR